MLYEDRGQEFDEVATVPPLRFITWVRLFDSPSHPDKFASCVVMYIPSAFLFVFSYIVFDVGNMLNIEDELIVTKSVPDVADVAVVAESVTLQQQYVFDVGLAEYVEDVAPDIAVSDEHVDDVPLYH